jgi:hypothetical protein
LLVEVVRHRALAKRESPLRSLLMFLSLDHALDEGLRVLPFGLGGRVSEKEQQHRQHLRE